MHPVGGKNVPAGQVCSCRGHFRDTRGKRSEMDAFRFFVLGASHRAPVSGLPGSRCGRGVPDSSMAEYRAGHASLFMMENTGGRAASPRGV